MAAGPLEPAGLHDRDLRDPDREARHRDPPGADGLPRHAAPPAIETAFATRLRQIGVRTTLVDARAYNHGQVNNRIGAPGDTVMTPRR